MTYKNGRGEFCHGGPGRENVTTSAQERRSQLAGYVFSDQIGSVCYMAVDGLKEEAYEYNYDIDGECVTDLCKGIFRKGNIWLKNIGMSEKKEKCVVYFTKIVTTEAVAATDTGRRTDCLCNTCPWIYKRYLFKSERTKEHFKV